MTLEKIKLKAQDAEDIDIISALLQDSIVPVCDMLYDPKEERFILVAQRRYLSDINTIDHPERCCAAVRIEGVKNARLHQIDLSQTTQMLDLLALIYHDRVLTFIFAGDAKIRLELGEWVAFLDDFGDPWPSQCMPKHEDLTDKSA